jgi:hypothetical protein
MGKKIERNIRLPQVTSNYGVAALYDILGESLVLMDTTVWLKDVYHGKGREIKAARLLESLRSSNDYSTISNLFEPAVKSSFGRSGSLPFMRFPRWLFCSTCRRMKQWSFDDEIERESPVCPHCERHPKLTPMRFITICEEGHMSDVDWIKWAHSRPASEPQKICQSRDLEFVTAYAGSGGLDSIGVKCRSCGAQRSLDGITAPNVLQSVGVWCTGKQPWQRGIDAKHCKSRTHVVQRGAGNVYYPQIVSALTIPPESRYQEGEPVDLKRIILDDPLAQFLSDRSKTMLFNEVVKMIAEKNHCSWEAVIAAADSIDPEAARPGNIPDIEAEEWNALITEIPEVHDRDEFVTRHIDLSAGNPLSELPACIDKLVSVIKLREVRVLTGFFRYQPGGSEENGPVSSVRPDLNTPLTWLPAVEAFGEGIFLTLNEPTLQQWEKLPGVSNRAKVLDARAKKSPFGFLPPVTPRFVLLHTLSHLLIRRLAFECGYSSASLRERIYSKVPGSEAKAGLLIYTAAGDSEGTLGGLARQAESGRFRETLLLALQDAAGCSADPICMESKGQGLGTLNLAACHACTLVSETSCTSSNLILDRAMVIGGSGVPGFFQLLLNSALELTLKAGTDK